MSQPPVPPSVHVTHTIGAMDFTTIYLTQGRTRFVMQEEEPGKMSPVSVIEWVHTLALSPQSAHHIMICLSQCLSDYTQKYGPIPEDKAFTAKIIGDQGSVQ